MSQDRLRPPEQAPGHTAAERAGAAAPGSPSSTSAPAAARGGPAGASPPGPAGTGPAGPADAAPPGPAGTAPPSLPLLADAYAPPARSRGSIALAEENCTVCMLCARECPSWCITIDAHDELGPPLSPGGRPRSRYVLDRFAIDWSLCMYCGICVEVCPFDALFWTPDAEYPATVDGALVHERERLRAWLDAVPPPEPPDAADLPPA